MTLLSRAMAGRLAGMLLVLMLPHAAHAQTTVQGPIQGPPMPPAPFSIAHPAPPLVAPIEAGADPDTATPVLAPAPTDRKDDNTASVTCFACPSGQDYYHGSICMNGVACAAEGITLQQLNIGVGKDNTVLTEALHKLEAAKAALAKPKGDSRALALRDIDTALSELKNAGLKTACKIRTR